MNIQSYSEMFGTRRVYRDVFYYGFEAMANLESIMAGTPV